MHKKINFSFKNSKKNHIKKLARHAQDGGFNADVHSNHTIS
jgi:hypothetical protein